MRYLHKRVDTQYQQSECHQRSESFCEALCHFQNATEQNGLVHPLPTEGLLIESPRKPQSDCFDNHQWPVQFLHGYSLQRGRIEQLAHEVARQLEQ